MRDSDPYQSPIVLEIKRAIGELSQAVNQAPSEAEIEMLIESHRALLRRLEYALRSGVFESSPPPAPTDSEVVRALQQTQDRCARLRLGSRP